MPKYEARVSVNVGFPTALHRDMRRQVKARKRRNIGDYLRWLVEQDMERDVAGHQNAQEAAAAPPR